MIDAREVRSGLIPAHAGKTNKHAIIDNIERAHPRACGENIEAMMQEVKEAGSSPRMRGKPLRVRLGAFNFRLIPAHAGKTH